jgi:hypothetical protein
MYVCPKCNSVVDQPRKRWWSQWRYCPNGHVLYVPGLGASREQSFWKSFVKGFALSIIVVFWIILALTIDSYYHERPALRSVEGFLGVWVALFYFAWGLILLARARGWAEREGAVQKLVPCAKGRACGLLASVFCQLGIVVALLFVK